ncbi:HAAS signaling domain-containing protein [Kribbella sp. CA-245084]|uniref:HAAS signaling domain-containing protein n=1 Tax=Kribbella sp. CA-245084 TaxID=3239940 RepID=UPI003D8F7197
MNMELDSNRLVDAYLDELATEAAVLPAGRRDELLDDMKTHIAEARAAGATSEDEIREVLQRLGRPSEIVAAATDGLVQVEVGPRLRPQDFVAVGLLLVAPYLLSLSLIVAVVGWGIGLGLLWTSNRWTTIWKLIGTLSWPLGYAVALALDMFVQPPIGIILAADTVVSVGLIAALVLNARAPRQTS